MNYLENADYFVHKVSLPYPVKGFVVPNDDGTFSMYLNNLLDNEHLMDAYIHEYLHLINEDHYSDKPIQQVENSAELNSK